jgi:CTP:molybdopterin cytidylyltransferase MocA
VVEIERFDRAIVLVSADEALLLEVEASVTNQLINTELATTLAAAIAAAIPTASASSAIELIMHMLADVPFVFQADCRIPVMVRPTPTPFVTFFCQACIIIVLGADL